MKRVISCVFALLLAGSVFCLGGWTAKVRTGVVIEGIEVGGMPYAEAGRCVRAGLVRTPFVLHTPAGDFTPDVVYTDDLDALLRRAKKGGEYAVTVRRELPDAEAFLEDVCAKNVIFPQDAQLSFSRKGFSYTAEKAGRWCDFSASLSAVLDALRTGEEACSLVTRKWLPEVTEEALRLRTQKLASFSTRFDASKTARVHNISLACERIAGSVIEPGEIFSFNETVGLRTRENGFLDAPVIVAGEFVSGTGGGVCQASTTLMGAALRAGLRVTESRPHSLSVGYVPPSQDAMVSRYSDLKFVNPYSFPVYLLGRTGEGNVTFEVYGMPDGKRYALESKVLETIEPPPAEVVEGEEEKVLRAEKAGLRSECYLLVYSEDGKLLSRKLFRRDRYACVQGKVQVLPDPPEQTPMPLPACMDTSFAQADIFR